MTPDWPALLSMLATPFDAHDILWRVGSVSKDRKRAQALPYAECRAYEDRLNDIVQGDWGCHFRPWGDGRIICELTIHGVTRSSTGEESEGGFAPGTAAEAQAFKRACSKFGLGRYLYDVPINWVAYDDSKKSLSEIPSLPKRFLPAPSQRDSPRSQGTLPSAGGSKEQTTPETLTLSPDRAKAMNRELEKLGIKRPQQYQIAAVVLGHKVEDFTTLTEGQALEVWLEAKRQTARAA